MLLWEPPAAIVEAGRIPRVLVVTLDVSHPYHAEFMHEVKLQHEWLEDAKTSLRQLLRENGTMALDGLDMLAIHTFASSGRTSSWGPQLLTPKHRDAALAFVQAITLAPEEACGCNLHDAYIEGLKTLSSSVLTMPTVWHDVCPMAGRCTAHVGSPTGASPHDSPMPIQYFAANNRPQPPAAKPYLVSEAHRDAHHAFMQAKTFSTHNDSELPWPREMVQKWAWNTSYARCSAAWPPTARGCEVLREGALPLLLLVTHDGPGSGGPVGISEPADIVRNVSEFAWAQKRLWANGTLSDIRAAPKIMTVTLRGVVPVVGAPPPPVTTAGPDGIGFMTPEEIAADEAVNNHATSVATALAQAAVAAARAWEVEQGMMIALHRESCG